MDVLIEWPFHLFHLGHTSMILIMWIWENRVKTTLVIGCSKEELKFTVQKTSECLWSELIGGIYWSIIWWILTSYKALCRQIIKKQNPKCVKNKMAQKINFPASKWYTHIICEMLSISRVLLDYRKAFIFQNQTSQILAHGHGSFHEGNLYYPQNQPK